MAATVECLTLTLRRVWEPGTAYIPGKGKKIFAFPRGPKSFYGQPTLLLSGQWRFFSLVGNRWMCEVDHSPSFCVNVRTEWS